jgi:stage II sporulation protein D
MSQYGADFMARQGSGYREILEHYYKGGTVEKY